MMLTRPFQVKQSLYENVARYIRKEIFLGKWPDGTHINEGKIAKMLNVSRGPVRDALKLLNNEGIIETPSNGRTIVTSFSKKDFNDWSQVRLYLETIAIKEALADGDVNNLDFTHMESIVEEMKENDDIDYFIYLDLLFHQSLIELSGNRTLSKLWNTISGPLATMLELIANNYENQDQVTIHENLLEVMKTGSIENACAEVEKHIEDGNMIIKKFITLVD